ncbi:MAG: ATP-binding protein [Elusimicrobiota bacterium]
MIVKREIQQHLVRLSRQYPVLTVTGPRQAGKTTLVKMAFPKLPYFNLEDPDIREMVELDPRAFLEKIARGAIIDEFQRVPTLTSYLQGFVDENKKNRKIILTGSHQLEVLNKVSQSLAGRTAIVKLLPFSISEANSMKPKLRLADYLYHGFYPRIYSDKLNPTEAYRNYFETYIERDLRQIIHIKDLRQFRKFVKLCAGRVGQIFIANNLANEIGVSLPTINAWLSICEASFIIFLLEPYHANIGKRLIKSPKLYFYDVGLASYLLGIENTKQIERDPLWGSLIENMVICELMKKRLNQGKDPQLFFYRDSNMNEVDVVFQSGPFLIPIEIKASQTFNQNFTKNLLYFTKLFPKQTREAYLIYSGNSHHSLGKIRLLNYKNVSDIFH